MEQLPLLWFEQSCSPSWRMHLAARVFLPDASGTGYCDIDVLLSGLQVASVTCDLMFMLDLPLHQHSSSSARRLLFTKLPPLMMKTTIAVQLHSGRDGKIIGIF